MRRGCRCTLTLPYHAAFDIIWWSGGESNPKGLGVKSGSWTHPRPKTPEGWILGGFLVPQNIIYLGTCQGVPIVLAFSIRLTFDKTVKAKIYYSKSML